MPVVEVHSGRIPPRKAGSLFQSFRRITAWHARLSSVIYMALVFVKPVLHANADKRLLIKVQLVATLHSRLHQELTNAM